MSALFAATYPQRVTALVLYGTMAAYTWSPEYPWAPPAEANESLALRLDATWGQGRTAERLAPSLAGDEAFRRWWARLERNSVGLRDFMGQAPVRADRGADLVPRNWRR